MAINQVVEIIVAFKVGELIIFHIRLAINGKTTFQYIMEERKKKEEYEQMYGVTKTYCGCIKFHQKNETQVNSFLIGAMGRRADNYAPARANQITPLPGVDHEVMSTDTRSSVNHHNFTSDENSICDNDLRRLSFTSAGGSNHSVMHAIKRMNSTTSSHSSSNNLDVTQKEKNLSIIAGKMTDFSEDEASEVTFVGCLETKYYSRKPSSMVSQQPSKPAG